VKKVLYIRSSFNAGGTESLIRNIYNAENNYFSIDLALLKEGELISDLSNPKNAYEIFKREKKIDFKVLKKLSALIKKDNIEIIHTHQEIELFYAVLLKLKHPGVKLIHHIHLFRLKKDWAFYLERILCRHFVKKIISVSKSLYSDLVAKGYSRKKLVVLLNAVKVNDEEKDEDLRTEFNKLINFQDADIVIGMIGNFVKEKDQDTLIKSFLLLSNEFPDLKLVLIGKENDNSHRALVPLSLLNKRVFFLGRIKNADNFIPFFRIFVFSTITETYGMAALEAMLKKVPVIASDIGAMKELSQNGLHFEMFKTKDEKALAQAIRNELKHPTSTDKLENAVLYVKNNFSIGNYIKELNAIYEMA
jgi:glycosyltransferase involved in cell wall biosynthesis